MEIRILLLFFASGFSGLIYEIAWIKLFSLSFGNTIYAVSTVLAAFMLGLSLGAFLFGKIADNTKRDIKIFGMLELGVGVSALAIALFFPFLDSFYVLLHNRFSLTPEGSTLLRFLSALVALSVPTILMGATLPVLCRCLIGNLSTAAPEISRLYGINTLGAGIGCFLCGYFLIPWLGVLATQYFAIGISFLIAASAFLLRMEFTRFLNKEENKERDSAKKNNIPRKESPVTLPALLILSLACMAGFCGLAYEVLWTRAFSLLFKSTVYLFSNILTVFLTGIAIGSLCYRKLLDRAASPLRQFGLIQIAIGLSGLASVIFFYWMPGEVSQGGVWSGSSSWNSHILKLFFLNFLVIIVPATLMGTSFPLINKVYVTSLGEIGKRTGRIYGVNVIGGILGSVAAGFLLIPWLGTQTGILAVAMISIAGGILAVMGSGADKGFGKSGFVLTFLSLLIFFTILISGKDIGTGLSLSGETVFQKEGLAGTVRVVKDQQSQTMTLLVNNYRLATTDDVAVRFGHIPLLLHPDPREVLTISLGAGITAGAIGRHEETERVDCVEIVPEVAEAAALFQKSNHDILSNPKLRLTIWDGRNYVQATQDVYDVIISDLFQPDSSGVGNLYSKEHYENCLLKLKTGGLMAQWLPLYQLHPDDLKSIMATFISVFPKTSLWFGDTNAAKPTLMLLGSRENIYVDPDNLAKRMQKTGVKKDLIEWNDPYSFLGFYVTDQGGVSEFLKDARINTDNHPVIEYSAPRNIWSRPKNAVKNFTDLNGIRTVFSRFNPEAGIEKEKMHQKKTSDYFKSRSLLLQGRIAHARGDFKREITLYKESEGVNPSDPYLGFSYFELGYLYLGQQRFKEAQWLLEKATVISPHLPEAHYFLSKVYLQAGEKKKAEKEYQLAMEALR